MPICTSLGKAEHIEKPFVSQAQRGFMYANHPDIAAEFEAKTPKGKKLPEHVEDAKKDDNPFAGKLAASSDSKPHMNVARSDAASERFGMAAKWHADRGNSIAVKNPNSAAVDAHHAASIAHRQTATAFDHTAKAAKAGNSASAKSNYSHAMDAAQDAMAATKAASKFDPSGKLPKPIDLAKEEARDERGRWTSDDVAGRPMGRWATGGGMPGQGSGYWGPTGDAPVDPKSNAGIRASVGLPGKPRPSVKK